MKSLGRKLKMASLGFSTWNSSCWTSTHEDAFLLGTRDSSATVMPSFPQLETFRCHRVLPLKQSPKHSSPWLTSVFLFLGDQQSVLSACFVLSTRHSWYTVMRVPFLSPPLAVLQDEPKWDEPCFWKLYWACLIKLTQVSPHKYHPRDWRDSSVFKNTICL